MTNPDRNTSPLALRTYRWEGLVFNLVCAAYFVVAAGSVAEAADAAMRRPEEKPIWLGILLAFLIVGETWAFSTKMRFVNQAIRHHEDSAGRAFYLWMFHAVISIILVFLIAGSFGFELGEGMEAQMPWWLMALIPTTVVKELVLLGFLMGGSGNEAPRPKFDRPSGREWVADAILVVFACVGYSATWSAITKGMTIDGGHPVMTAMNAFLSVLIFLIFSLRCGFPTGSRKLRRSRRNGMSSGWSGRCWS